MDLNKTLIDWNKKLREEGFNTFIFGDNEKIVCLEVATKKIKANVWNEQESLSLIVPFPNQIEKQIADRLESEFSKLAEERIKEVCFIDSKSAALSTMMKPNPLYLKYETMGMKAHVNSVEDVINLLKKFDEIYQKAR